MVLLKIAWRGVWRSRTRSAVVIFAIASGLLGGLFSSAWMNGMAQQRVENTFAYETGHIQIHHPGFIENKDVKMTINNVNQKINYLKENQLIEAVTPRLKVVGMAATANKNTGVDVIGIDKRTEEQVFELYQRIDTSSGGFFEQEKRNSIVISRALADELKVKLKSRIVLTFQDFNGEITGAAFKVVGLFKTDNNPWDKMNVFVLNDDLRRVLEVPDNQFHELVMLVRDFEQANIISAKIQTHYQDLLVQDWSALSPYLRMMSGYMDTMMGLFMMIILGALGFGIVNTMLMVVLERTRELGMLMAIGMTKRRIFLMIMFETILLALVGALIGELISILVIGYFEHQGIDLSAVAEGMESLGYGAVTYPMLEPYRYVQITILVIITGVLASIYPAYKALKLRPAEAIRTI